MLKSTRALGARTTCAGLAAALLAIATACAGDDTPPQEEGGPTPATAVAVPTPADREDLHALQWMEGRWRGVGADGTPFYEAYTFANDSTVTITYYSDAAFAASTGEGIVQLRGGALYHDAGSARWAATAIDSLSVSFEPADGTGNGFTWRQDARGHWTATLHPASGEETVYRMERVVD